jgi:uncharacterized protein YbjT (DUF2867 family)
MKKKIALLVGATGAVGSELMSLILNGKEFEELHVLARKQNNVDDNRLKWIVGDLLNYDFLKKSISEDVTHIFCCIGTTKNQTPNKQEYIDIDFGIPYNLINIGNTLPNVEYIGVVSAIGADSKSMVLYSRLKGQVEETLKESKVLTRVVAQPSLIDSERSKFRIGEWIALKLFTILNPLIPFSYKKISASTIAKALYSMSNQKADTGYIVLSNEQMLKKYK